jgi:hypothetical protein
VSATKIAKAASGVAAAQGLYYVATGVAPFISRRTFEAITGRKNDWWLVQTVGVLVTVLGAGLIHSAGQRKVTPKEQSIAIAAAAGLGALETGYALRRRISRIYLLDAALQAGFIGGWLASRWHKASIEMFLVSTK